MKKVKVSEATGPVLEWMVAKALGALDTEIRLGRATTKVMVPDSPHGVVDMRTGDYFRPSTTWSQGGPLIEREKISIIPFDGSRWEARCVCSIQRSPARFVERRGPTPLIAAMRCYVASKLGDEVEVPGELG